MPFSFVAGAPWTVCSRRLQRDGPGRSRTLAVMPSECIEAVRVWGNSRTDGSLRTCGAPVGESVPACAKCVGKQHGERRGVGARARAKGWGKMLGQGEGHEDLGELETGKLHSSWSYGLVDGSSSIGVPRWLKRLGPLGAPSPCVFLRMSPPRVATGHCFGCQSPARLASEPYMCVFFSCVRLVAHCLSHQLVSCARRRAGFIRWFGHVARPIRATIGAPHS